VLRNGNFTDNRIGHYSSALPMGAEEGTQYRCSRTNCATHRILSGYRANRAMVAMRRFDRWIARVASATLKNFP